jgi:outer membrane protein assembly factor BamD (BamD/ComL family)
MRQTPNLAHIFVLIVALAAAHGARAQPTEYRLDKSGQWEAVSTPDQGSDAAVIAEARNHIAESRPEKAKTLLDKWIAAHENEDNKFLPEAYLLRGDATTAAGNEYKALYDYERVVNHFAATEQFVTALERELDIGVKYVNGLKYRWLGVRIWDASDIGEELLIRVQERLPNSRLAERAGIELADYYYRTHDLELAGEAYELFLVNYPNSAYKQKAMERRVYSAIGQYKGPKYNSSSLLDAQALIKRFSTLYPSEAQEVGINDALVARLDESAAAELMESARWYMSEGDAVSARYTLSRLVQKYPSTAAGTLGLQVLTDRGWLTEKPKPPAEGATVPSDSKEGANGEKAPPAPASSPATPPAGDSKEKKP